MKGKRNTEPTMCITFIKLSRGGKKKLHVQSSFIQYPSDHTQVFERNSQFTIRIQLHLRSNIQNN